MNKFFAGKVKVVKGFAKEPHTGDARIVLIPVSNNGKFDTVPGNKSFDGFALATSYARNLYTAFYREKEVMDFGDFRTKLIAAGLDYSVISCYDGDKFVFEAFEKAVMKLAKDIRDNKLNVHWNKVSIPSEYDEKVNELVEREFLTHGINVYIYE